MEHVLIGIDGGGTKTEAVLMGLDGSVLSRGIGGSVNIMFAGAETANQSVRDAMSGLLAPVDDDWGKVAALGACIIGGYHELRNIAESGMFTGRRYMFNESTVAFRSAGMSSHRGIAVIAGTGSGVRYSDGRTDTLRVGGWGIAGDEGSAFDIGLRAIKAVGRAADGRGPATTILEMLTAEEDSKSFGHILHKYCFPSFRQREIASVAKKVSEAAGQGDEVAIRILREAGESLADDVIFVAGRVYTPDEVFDVAYQGGVFKSGRLVTDALEDRVRGKFPRARFHMPLMSPGEGVAHLALDRLMM